MVKHAEGLSKLSQSAQEWLSGLKHYFTIKRFPVQSLLVAWLGLVTPPCYEAPTDL